MCPTPSVRGWVVFPCKMLIVDAGHYKPFLVFIGRVAERRPGIEMHFTLLASAPIFQSVQRELKLMPSGLAKRFK
jgi:hypothetical protein